MIFILFYDVHARALFYRGIFFLFFPFICFSHITIIIFVRTINENRKRYYIIIIIECRDKSEPITYDRKYLIYNIIHGLYGIHVYIINTLFFLIRTLTRDTPVHLYIYTIYVCVTTSGARIQLFVYR